MRLLLALCLFLPLTAGGQQRPDVALLERVCHYRETVPPDTADTVRGRMYQKFVLQVPRRNIALLPVPTMYMIAHGPRRRYISEEYIETVVHGDTLERAQTLLQLSTVPRHRRTMTTIYRYLWPTVYAETLFGPHVLSPFRSRHRRLYRYHFKYLGQGIASIAFRPRTANTQLAAGRVTVDIATGRIIEGSLRGEYDMIRYQLSFRMGTGGAASLLPATCDLMARFTFLGNRVQAHTTAVYHLPLIPHSTFHTPHSTLLTPHSLMASIRPDTLSAVERAMYDEDRADTLRVERKRSWAKRVFWDIIGDNLLNKITASYGQQGQGSLRILPLFNPLYMGYSGHKGYYYKVNIRTTYRLSDNSSFYTRLKAGYTFGQKRFYFRLPVEYYWDERRHGRLSLMIRNGSIIRNGVVRDAALAALPDTAGTGTPIDTRGLDDFKDFFLSLLANYDLSPHWSLEAGIAAHRRAALHPEFYRQAGLPSHYSSVAPRVELTWRPRGWQGPVVSLSYERGLRGLLGASLNYERWEADLQHIRTLGPLQSLSFRAGAGLYTRVDRQGISFLDYTNFRDNTLPDGWNDEWSGEFPLLHSEWYNLSRYYVRTNATYETPMLALARLPRVGRYIERERIYASALLVTHLHPYIELGYGFTTRWVSLALFVASRNGGYDGFGVKAGLELFRRW